MLELAHVDADRASVAVTTAVFFAVLGGALVWCASGLWRVRSWARSPVVVVQLITLLTAWSFVGGETTWVAAVLAAVSVVGAGRRPAPAEHRGAGRARGPDR